jgi:predicted acetyltransferase
VHEPRLHGGVSMNVTVSVCKRHEMQTLHNLYQFYLHDLSSFTDANTLEPNGRFDTRHIDVFWEKESLFPYLIYDDGRIAGFALVAGEPYSSEGSDYSLAEFFVLRQNRLRGVGRMAAHLVFDEFHGVWDVYQMPANQPAIKFWTEAIHQYTHGNFNVLEDGNRQRFSNAV